MKILFLTRRFYPDIGGVEKHVLEIGKRLVKDGHEITVITQSSGNENQINGIKIKRINKSPKNWSMKLYVWKWFFENINLIKNADIVHAHDVYFWYFPFRFLFPRKKSFVTFHGYESYPITKKAILVRKLSEKLASGNIIVGDFIRKWYGTKTKFVIYGGVDLSYTKTELENLNSAVFIGRLDEQTGVLDYAKSVDIIKKSDLTFDFAIIGDGKYKNQLKEFKLLGFKNHPEKYLKKYNFAFVSRYLSILEALANRNLVFALYDNPVKEDYLKMAPFAKFIIIESSPEKLAEKVKFYQKEKTKQKKLINEGYAWVKNQTWENVVSKYINLWTNMV